METGDGLCPPGADRLAFPLLLLFEMGLDGRTEEVVVMGGGT